VRVQHRRVASKVAAGQKEQGSERSEVRSKNVCIARGVLSAVCWQQELKHWENGATTDQDVKQQKLIV